MILNNFRTIACNETKILSTIHVNECFRIGIDLKNNSADTITIRSSGSLGVIFDKSENIKLVGLISHMPFNIKILSGASIPAITSNGYKIDRAQSLKALLTITVVTHSGDVKKFSKSFVIDIV